MFLSVRQHGDEIDSDREETVAKFKSYFAQSGMRGFYAMPLIDDTGRVGVLALESSDPDFLGPAHVEILQLLASQATVALRNAQMYKEVPFISVLEPVLARKRKFMAMEKRRRTLIVVGAIAAVIFLVAFPFPLRVDGDAVVTPLHRVQIQPEAAGVVYRVLVHEGDRVNAGDVLAEMENWNSRYSLAEAQAKHESALMQMNHALAVNDGSVAGAQQVQADYWQAELVESAGSPGQIEAAFADRRSCRDAARRFVRWKKARARRFFCRSRRYVARDRGCRDRRSTTPACYAPVKPHR